MSMIKNLSVDLLEKATLVWTEVNQLTPLTDEGFVYPPEEYQNRPRRIIDPTPEERREILSIFKQEGAIKILREIGFGRRNVPYRWVVEVINPRFNEVEGELKKLYLKAGQNTFLKGADTTENKDESTQQGKIETATASTLSYDDVACKISFRDKSIPIPQNTDQESLCRVVFADKNNVTQVWSWDEMLEKWGGNYESKDAWRKVYNAGREVNKKIAIETGVKDLLIVKKHTVTLNPKYLK